MTPASIHKLIRTQSERTPDAVALRAPNYAPLTYQGLATQVDYVGEAFRSLGVSSTDRVVVVLPNGPAMASTFLGVAAYATCAPLNPLYREDDFEFYFQDLEASAVILDARVGGAARNVAQRLGIRTIELESEPSSMAGQLSFENVRTRTVKSLSAPSAGETAALVLHTSGTTSRPKQVPLSHRNPAAAKRSRRIHRAIRRGRAVRLCFDPSSRRTSSRARSPRAHHVVLRATGSILQSALSVYQRRRYRGGVPGGGTQPT